MMAQLATEANDREKMKHRHNGCGYWMGRMECPECVNANSGADVHHFRSHQIHMSQHFHMCLLAIENSWPS